MARFVKGQSGNPGGRPKQDHNLVELAKARTEQALLTLAEIMSDDDSPASARVAAACAILDRGHGKPVQMTESPTRIRQTRSISSIHPQG